MKSVLSQIISCSGMFPILGNCSGEYSPACHSSGGLRPPSPSSFSSFPIQTLPFSSLSFLPEPHVFVQPQHVFSCLFMLCSLVMKIAWLLPWPENFFLLLIQSSPTFSSFIQVSSYLIGSFNSLHAPYSTVSSFVESREFRIVGQSTLVE